MSGPQGSPGAEEPQVVRVVVADDQAIVREGIVMLLGLLPGIEVVGSARDGEEAIELTRTQEPDVVLMDLRMPRCDGVEATRRIRARFPRTEVVVLTTYADDDSLFPALRAGARGYLTKDAGGEDIARAVRDVVDGRAGLSPSVQRRLLEQLMGRPEEEGRAGAPAGDGGTGDLPQGRSGPGGQGASGGPGVPRTPGGSGGTAGWGGAAVSAALEADGLTERETEVLVLVADGLSNHEIAGRLRISTATVKTHINNLFAKTGVRDRAQAVRYAYQHGLVRAPSRRVT
ncbi:response regulator [Streptomyces sp. NPDC048330]|uniref:response regulator n=1 Tax=Streptomyces sp. NPDC048330 TaxID=3365533 RepID=UPI00371DF81E